MKSERISPFWVNGYQPFSAEKNPADNSKLVLTINRQPIEEWFKEQWKKFRQRLQQSAEEPRKSKGFRL